ncbi:MAG: glycosyltransferase family 9 protein [FCB group bacterium]|nr:glycosyltransferase family 9 protein [FCB group bacterium]
MSRSFLKMLEHGFKRVFFALVSFFLKKGREEFAIIDPMMIKRVLFIRPEKLGDMVISLPVFHNLKRLYPHLELYTISSPRNIAVICEDERICSNFLYTKKIFRDIATVRKIRRLGIDAVVDMVCDDSVTALLLTQWSSAAAWRIGVGKNHHKRYYDFNYLYRTGDESHVVENTLKLLTAFGIETDNLEGHIPPTIRPEHKDLAARFVASLNGTMLAEVIGVNISAGRPTRVWPDEKNEELIGRLLDRFKSCRIVISSDPRERERAVALAGRFQSRVDPLPEGLNLLEVSAVISRMNILITPDTSLVHIARAFMVPVVGLYTRFGQNFMLWKPYNQDGGAVISGNDYNIFDIEVDEVFEAAVALMPAEKP